MPQENKTSKSIWSRLFPCLTKSDLDKPLTLRDLLEMEKRIMADIDPVLAKIDAATTKIAANVQTIADVDQKISDEIDAFLASAQPGTVFTDAQVATLQSFGDRLQASSDASDAQVAVLQAIAAKGATNPVPVPVPAPPTVG